MEVIKIENKDDGMDNDKKQYRIGFTAFAAVEVVAESPEEAKRKVRDEIQQMFDPGDYTQGDHYAEYESTDEPPKNEDGDLVCGRTIVTREESGIRNIRRCQNRVSEPFEPCHLHDE